MGPRDGRKATIRYIGAVWFPSKHGEMIGVELDPSQKKGKQKPHNGFVDGKRYFKCPPATGLFVIPAEIKKNLGRAHVSATAAAQKATNYIKQHKKADEYMQKLMRGAPRPNAPRKS